MSDISDALPEDSDVSEGGAVTLCGGVAAAEARGAGGSALLMRGDRTLALAMNDVQLTGAQFTCILVQKYKY